MISLSRYVLSHCKSELKSVINVFAEMNEMNVTNPKNPKVFKMHPQPNKLFQTYQNQLIFRLQVVTTLFKISVNHSISA